MTLSYLPDDRVGFVPRPCGFGARLLGIDPGAARTVAGDAIVATRQERDLLRGDLTLVGADGTLLPEALGCPVGATARGSWRVDGPSTEDPEDWDAIELGDLEDLPALNAALSVVSALASEGPMGVVLSGPVTLATCVAGRPIDAGREVDQDLIDVCAMAVCDAAKAVHERGGHVVLEERRAPTVEEVGFCSSLLNLLAHHRRPALMVVVDGDGGGLQTPPAGIGAVVHGPAAPDWDTMWPKQLAQPVFAPRIAADASPERVQELIREMAVHA